MLCSRVQFSARAEGTRESPLAKENRMTKTKKLDFRPNEFVVYPAHGVGQIISVEEQEVAGITLELFVISFEKDKMTLRVPTHKATEIGMRALSTPDVITHAMKTLKGRAKVKRAMWSRRAQEYEQKINSGDLIAIAEVVRDLHRTDDQREQSYSERQLYEAALERLTREVAAVGGGDEIAAAKQVGDVLDSRVAA
jgi:CarD family transcriptional regulator